MTFKVIEVTTGKDISDISKADFLAKNDIKENTKSQFYTGEDGKIVIIDEHNNITEIDSKKLIIKRTDKYPDIEYLEKVIVSNIFNKYGYILDDLRMYSVDVEMFNQTWGSTACGWEEPGMIAGQAFTSEYTTVIKVDISLKKSSNSMVFYGVCFGNKVAYLVNNANERFLDDLAKHRIASISEAHKIY